MEKLLKLDPTNVTLLAQKQKLLTQEIEATGVLAAGVKKELSSEVGFRGIAILYAFGYLYEHREEADHHALLLTLRSLLFAVREGVNF